MLKLYGNYMSRTRRCLWMLEELGQDYELVEVKHRLEENKTEAYAAINPNQHIPTLVDGDLVLWESMAINLYLADRYDGGLKPKTVQAAARTYQWTFWVMLETEHHFLTTLRHRSMYPEEHRRPEKAAEAEAALRKPLQVLDAALAATGHLAGEAFGVADLNVASVAGWGRRGEIPFADYPHVASWLESCLARPSWQRVVAASPPPGERQFPEGWQFE